MELNQEDDTKSYITLSRNNIDNYIYKNQYKQAFMLLTMVLQTLNDDDKRYLINYYNKNLNNLALGISHLDGRRLNC